MSGPPSKFVVVRWRKGCFYSEISSTLFSSCVVTSPMWVHSHLVTSLNKMTRHNSQQDKWHNVDFNIFTGFLSAKIKQTSDQTSVLITIRACRIFHPVCKSHFCKEEIILRVQHFHRVSPWCLESGGRSNTHISEISHDRGSGAKARWQDQAESEVSCPLRRYCGQLLAVSGWSDTPDITDITHMPPLHTVNSL